MLTAAFENSALPWLDQKGIPLKDDQLKNVSKNWDHLIWEQYLNWHETPLKESQLDPFVYLGMLLKLEQSIFYDESFDDDALKIQITEKLENLTKKQRLILKMIFWEGLSERSIAAMIGQSRSGVRETKKRALLRLSKSLRPPLTNIPLMKAKIISLSSGVNNVQENFTENLINFSEVSKKVS